MAKKAVEALEMASMLSAVRSRRAQVTEVAARFSVSHRGRQVDPVVLEPPLVQPLDILLDAIVRTSSPVEDLPVCSSPRQWSRRSRIAEFEERLVRQALHEHLGGRICKNPGKACSSNLSSRPIVWSLTWYMYRMGTP